MRHMTHRRGNAVIVGMVFLLALFSNAALAKTQIQFWDGQNWEIIKTLVAEFNAQSETVEVILGDVPGGGEFLERLTTAALGNALPDISRVEGGWVPQLAVNNLILPTSEYAPEGARYVDPSEVLPGIFVRVSYRGVQYAVPDPVETHLVFYNRARYENAGFDPNHPPANWDNFMAAARRLTEDRSGDGTPETYGYAAELMGFGGAWQWGPYLWSNGSDYLSEDLRQVRFNDNAGVEILSRLVEGIRQQYVTVAPWNGMTSHKAAMEFLPANWTVFFEANGVDAAPMPFPSNTGAPVLPLGGWVIVAHGSNGDPERIRAVQEFLEWYTRPENQVRVAMDQNMVPPLRSHIASDLFQAFAAENPLVHFQASQAGYYRPHPATIHFGELLGRILPGLQRAASGEIDPRQAMDQVAVQVQAIIDGR